MKPVMGIRREDKNEWERRVPLSPDHVRELTGQGIEVLVQPSEIRVFKDMEYAGAGAVVQEDLSSCNVVFGVKEFPISIFRDNQAYMFFSHTIKGQKYNMPMLQTLLDKNCTLMDYEKILNEKNFRLVFFGNYAGLAGMTHTPARDNFSMFSSWILLIGVSLGTIMSLRRSFSVTEPARVITLSPIPQASFASVVIEQGTITIASNLWLPEHMSAPMS